MKRDLIGILSLVVMSLLFNATGAYAQSYAKADVPFAFSVGSVQLPAGLYEVKVANSIASSIMIQNHATSAAALSVTRREYPRHTGAKLVFHRIGDRYFLAEVWRSPDAEGMIIPTSKQEKDLAKERQLAKGLSSRNEEVIVALN